MKLVTLYVSCCKKEFNDDKGIDDIDTVERLVSMYQG